VGYDYKSVSFKIFPFINVDTTNFWTPVKLSE